MKLYVLFGQRKETYEGQFAPEALDVIDEYSMEDNTEYMDKSLAQQMEKYGDHFEGMAWFPIVIEGDVEVTVRQILLQQYQALSASLIDPTEPEKVTRSSSVTVTTDITPGTIPDDEIRG